MAAATDDPFGRTTADRTESAADRGASEGLHGQARAAVDDLEERARGLAGNARARVRAAANRPKDAAAAHLHGFASALRTAADDLSRRDQGFGAGCFEQVAEGLEQVSGALQDRDMAELVDDVEDFARRRRVAFLGGTVLAGLVLARLMKSSAARREPSDGDATPAEGR
jgi:hypothetical protein